MAVTAVVGAAPGIGVPQFTACPAATGTTCKISSLPAGQADELAVSVPVQAAAPLGEIVVVTADASAAGSQGYGGTAVDVVVLTTVTTGAVNLPVPGVLPLIAGTGVNAINPSALFPTVGGAPTGTSVDPAASGNSVLRAATDASTVPLASHYMGIQLVGLVVLFGALVIAVVRVSLRTPRPDAPARRVKLAKTSGPSEQKS